MIVTLLAKMQQIDIKGNFMRWAVEYQLPSGTYGLCLFEAENEQAAQKYVLSMYIREGHYSIFTLKQLPEGATVNDLYRLFPCRVSSNG